MLLLQEASTAVCYLSLIRDLGIEQYGEQSEGAQEEGPSTEGFGTLEAYRCQH
jgi:hypothetical protein